MRIAPYITSQPERWGDYVDNAIGDDHPFWEHLKSFGYHFYTIINDTWRAEVENFLQKQVSTAPDN